MTYEVNGRQITSEVLLKLKEELLPHLPIACKTCPMAMWQVHDKGKEIKAYCRVMHAYTWSTTKPTEILDCDALYQTEEEEEEPFLSLIQGNQEPDNNMWANQAPEDDYGSDNENYS